MSEIATYRRMVYEKYLSYFTIQLNLIQDMDEDSKYWGLIIGPWLIEYINLTEFLYRSGKNNTDLNFNLTNNIVPFDYTSFILLKNSLDFNKQLEYCYSKKEINTSSCTLSVAYESVGCSRFKSFSLACVELFLFKFVKNKIVLVDAYIGSANLISIFFKSKFKLIPYAMREQTPTKSINLRKNLRLWRVDVESSNDYELTLSENILNHIPYVYMEGFKSLRLSVKNLSPKMFVSSTGMYGNERLKVASAEIKKKKGVLIGMQHGGGPYGIANMNTVEIEIGNLDKFLTWGWESQENTQAFYSFRLSQLAADCKKTINPIPNKYLYLGTVIDMHATDGNPIPSGEVFKNCYILWQHRFFIGLNESIRKKIIYRGYPDDKRYGWHQNERLKSLDIKIIMDTEISYSKSISSASLVICDNLFSTFFESVSIDKPTILFFNEACWKVNLEFESLLIEMEGVGMFHRTPELAISMVEEIDGDINAWWGNDKVKEIKRKIIDKYARSKSNIVDLLLDELNKE